MKQINLLTLLLLETLLESYCSEVSGEEPYFCVWNSPTITCERYTLAFDLSKFDIVQNLKDSFKGENITIFYGPGKFPKIDHKTGDYTNGGIPQLGNLTYHLEQLTEDVQAAIPNKNFQGLGVLDFEAWRPLFKHNFDWLKIYQKASEDLVKKQHPSWTNNSQIEQEAEKQFNTAAREFFESTLNTVKELRPGGRWGYYGFPRCYGKHGNFCAPGSQEDNDLLQWLWNASSVLYPRIYLAEDTDRTDKIFFLMATVHEAVRVSSQQPPGKLLVYPYSRHSYDSAPGHFYSEEDLWLSHAISSLLGGDGIVIWGSTKSMESQTLCTDLYKYTDAIFGPFVKSFTQWTRECSKQLCSSHGRCVAKDIPPVLHFYDEITQSQLATSRQVPETKWMVYFIWLLYEGYGDKNVSENYSCKCYPDWKGGDCNEPVALY